MVAAVSTVVATEVSWVTSVVSSVSAFLGLSIFSGHGATITVSVSVSLSVTITESVTVAVCVCVSVLFRTEPEVNPEL